MGWIFKIVWSYRNEIILTLQLLEKMRKTAAETASEYIHQQIRKSLVKGLASLAFQILLLWVAHKLYQYQRTLHSELYASVVLWLITLNNLFQLVFYSFPEQAGLYRVLKGKVGFTLKHFFCVSLVSELTHPHLLILIFCFILGVGSRWQMSRSFSYIDPWIKLAQKK